MNAAKKSGHPCSRSNSSIISRCSSVVSSGAKFASRACLVCCHMFSTGFVSGVAVQPLGDDLAMLCQGGFHGPRTTVDLRPVP